MEIYRGGNIEPGLKADGIYEKKRYRYWLYPFIE